MSVRTYYETLGVQRGASPSTIREAYRSMARKHHPDRLVDASEGAAVVDMAELNEAYRVLGDEGRRTNYDATLRDDPEARSRTGSVPAASDFEALRDSLPSCVARARFPWRGLLIGVGLSIIGGLALTQFTGTRDAPPPDGILRVGDCVDIEADNDAVEVPCTADAAADSVVREVVGFDASCPGGTEPHRDGLGMGVVCVVIPE